MGRGSVESSAGDAETRSRSAAHFCLIREILGFGFTGWTVPRIIARRCQRDALQHQPQNRLPLLLLVRS